jgi:hypothetical protein
MARYQVRDEWDDTASVIDTSISGGGVPGVVVSGHQDESRAALEAHRLNELEEGK